MKNLLEFTVLLLEAEARIGFPNLLGSRVKGRVGIPETLLNSILENYSYKFIVSLRKQNIVVLEYRLWNFPLSVSLRIEEIDRDLTIHLRRVGGVPIDKLPIGVLLAWASRAGLPIRLQQNLFLIYVGSIPQIMAWRYLWRFLAISVETHLAQLQLNFDIDIPKGESK